MVSVLEKYRVEWKSRKNQTKTKQNKKVKMELSEKFPLSIQSLWR